MRAIVPLFFFASLASAQRGGEYTPDVKPASNEGRQAMAAFKVPPGFSLELYAAEPLLANPVAFYPADTGEFYVAESFRLHKGVTDIREHMDWLDDDNASTTIDDLVAMFKKHLGPQGFADILKERERVRVIRDTDGDGFADKATVFADSFGDAADGIGAGLLKWNDSVYYTCMPNLWLLQDKDGDDRAEVQRSLSYGYGVHVQFLGHDLHGLAMGPDGRLYFSCGDRGFHVQTPEGLLDYTHAGAVLRCELDGSHLEIYHFGLRNPQELAFDAWGNLFTGDNNGDGGDEAKWIQILEGADSGWRNGWQWVDEPMPRGMFNTEKLWAPHFEGQAAFLLPPIANVASGPSGLCYEPGTCLPEEWRNHFFLCDFTGTPSSSTVTTLAMKPKGAGFELVDKRDFVRGALVTDCDFGPDGALYFSDWVAGWGQTGKGRLYRTFDPKMRKSAATLSVQKLLHDGMKNRRESELGQLLNHDDLRVRLRAELELTTRGEAGLQELDHAMVDGRTQFAQLHGIWGLGVCGRRTGTNSLTFMALRERLSAPLAEIRAQTAHVLGDLRDVESVPDFVKLLRDPSPRVRMYAAFGLARTASPMAVAPLLDLMREIKVSDPTLRHAAIHGLSKCAKSKELAALVRDPSIDVRLAAVVALRRQASAEVATFLADGETLVAAEAARAVYDTPIPAAMPALAALTRRAKLDDRDLARRAVHAAWRLGTPDSAREIARFALRTDLDEYTRAEALGLLGKWKEPHGRDPLLGEWRPQAARDDSALSEIVRALDAEEIGRAPGKVTRAWVALAGQYKVKEATLRLTGWALDPKADAKLRSASLAALEPIASADLKETLKKAIGDASDEVRGAALGVLEHVAPAEALPYLETALGGGRAERRAAYRALGGYKDAGADALLAKELDRLAADLVPGEVALDLVEACEKRKSKLLDAQIAQRNAPRAMDKELAPYLDCLLGGDASKGRELFREKSELSCLRCHRIPEAGMEKEEGGLVGPNLKGVGQRLTRLELAESILAPNRKIAAGFQGTIVFRTVGGAVEGIVIEDTPSVLRLRDKDDKIVEVDRTEIEAIKPGQSSMPANLKDFLSREELRDLVEFLSHQ